MTTKQFWLAGIATASASMIFPGLIVGYFAIAIGRWIDLEPAE
tara:strand:- start:936 stop:1064 length:129 start_codon:yes stop_codon:yes gene_type:complete